MRMPNVGETSEFTSPDAGVVYYGVYIPNDTNLGEDNDQVHVYTDKTEALKLVKKYKKARFKAFQLREAAEEFAEHGSESSGATVSTPERSGPVAEKPSPFKAPKPQDLVQLRKAIETGATDIVKKIVLDNPRYLISIGDTPAILQEGSRYNALHVAAKARRDDICEFILDTVGDPAFISRLYGDDDMTSCQSRANILLDLYLNTPDKGLNETPLHFASKFGATAVVAKLVSYSECDKHPKNKFSQTPKDMICSRAPSSNATDAKTIKSLLEEQFYVPVLRSEDNSLPPTVGEPFSPSRPPALVQHVVNPTVDIHAYAGPMPQEEAKIFRKKWKTPPRSVSSSAGTPTRNDSPMPLSTAVRLMDTEKGLERIGRTLAHETKVGWKEYWPFLGTFTDFATKEGLDLLEAYIKKRFQETWGKHVSNDASLNNKDHFNMMQLTNTACGQIDTPSEGSSQGKNCVVSPITDLCVAFKACSLEENCEAYARNEYHSPVKQVSTQIASVEEGDKGKAKLTSCEHESFTAILENPDICPLLYVEKSCQVFAKRIADGLIHKITIVHRVQTDDIIFETLWPEVKHIQRVVSSFMDDPRFVSVDFHRIHSRISLLACPKLNTLPQDDLDFILNCLQSEIKVVKNADTVSSDEEDSGTVSDSVQYRSQKIIPSNDKSESLIEQQVKCFENNILSALMKHGGKNMNINNVSCSLATTEEECKNMWSSASPCLCKLQNQLFARRSRMGASFKRACKNSGVNFNTMQEISRRLNFQCWQGEDNLEKHCEHKDLTRGGNGDVDNDGNRSDDDKFFTPPGSPHDSNEEFVDVSDDEDVFLEGNTPGKVDLDVLHALAGVDILKQKYPNIYRWRHAILLYPEKEREQWASPAFTRHLKRLQTPGTLTPTSRQDDGFLSSPDAWHRRLVRCTHAPRTVDFSSVT